MKYNTLKCLLKKCKSLKVRLVKNKFIIYYIYSAKIIKYKRYTISIRQFSSFFVVVDFKRLTFLLTCYLWNYFLFFVWLKAALWKKIEMKLKLVEFLLLLFFTFKLSKTSSWNKCFAFFFPLFIYSFQSVREINSFKLLLLLFFVVFVISSRNWIETHLKYQFLEFFLSKN